MVETDGQDVGSHVFLVGSDPQTDRLIAKALGRQGSGSDLIDAGDSRHGPT